MSSLHRPGYIYAVAGEGPGEVKLGASDNPQRRAKELLASKFRPRVVAYHSVQSMALDERLMHWVFRFSPTDKLVRTYEWFDVDPAEVALVVGNWNFFRPLALAEMPSQFTILRWRRSLN